MRLLTALIVIVAVGIIAFVLYSAPTPAPAAASIPTNDVTANAADGKEADIPFVQGGTIALSLQGADYKLVPSGDDHIRISYRKVPYNTGATRIDAGVSGANANVRIQTPSGNGIHVEIAVPAKTNLYARTTAGNMIVEGIEGSKDVEMRAGNLVLAVTPDQYKHVYASISSGNLSAEPWTVHMGGLLRTFKTNGPGKYGLHAHVGAGSLTLTEHSELK